MKNLQNRYLVFSLEENPDSGVVGALKKYDFTNIFDNIENGTRWKYMDINNSFELKSASEMFESECKVLGQS